MNKLFTLRVRWCLLCRCGQQAVYAESALVSAVQVRSTSTLQASRAVLLSRSRLIGRVIALGTVSPADVTTCSELVLLPSFREW